jgi:hypothetical protein
MQVLQIGTGTSTDFMVSVPGISFIIKRISPESKTYFFNPSSIAILKESSSKGFLIKPSALTALARAMISSSACDETKMTGML